MGRDPLFLHEWDLDALACYIRSNIVVDHRSHLYIYGERAIIHVHRSASLHSLRISSPLSDMSYRVGYYYIRPLLC